MTTYIVKCYIPGRSIDATIEAREMTVKDGAYQFWKGNYGQTNELIASYPVTFTVVETVEKSETNDKRRKIPSVPKEEREKLSEGSNPTEGSISRIDVQQCMDYAWYGLITH